LFRDGSQRVLSQNHAVFVKINSSKLGLSVLINYQLKFVKNAGQFLMAMRVAKKFFVLQLPNMRCPTPRFSEAHGPRAPLQTLVKFGFSMLNLNSHTLLFQV
jgi:hypothetical protein